jgi:hypothetical protein
LDIGYTPKINGHCSGEIYDQPIDFGFLFSDRYEHPTHHEKQFRFKVACLANTLSTLKLPWKLLETTTQKSYIIVNGSNLRP